MWGSFRLAPIKSEVGMMVQQNNNTIKHGRDDVHPYIYYQSVSDFMKDVGMSTYKLSDPIYARKFIKVTVILQLMHTGYLGACGAIICVHFLWKYVSNISQLL